MTNHSMRRFYPLMVIDFAAVFLVEVLVMHFSFDQFQCKPVKYFAHEVLKNETIYYAIFVSIKIDYVIQRM